MRKFFPRYNLLIAENAVNQHTLINDAADVARKLVLENLQKGIDYMKVPEHREKLMEDGIHIFKLILGNRKSITFIDKNMQ